MEKTAMKVFLACAFGAFIGSMVALQLNRYFWWLGLIVGGFAGYISYEFERIKTAAPQAWKTARKVEIRFEVIKKGGKALMYCLLACLASLIVGFCFFVNFYLVASISPRINFLEKILLLVSGPENLLVTSILGLFITLVFLGLIITGFDDKFGNYSNNEFIGFAISLVAAPILSISLLALYAIYKLTPTVARFTTRFTKQFFLLIHSDIRLLCATDAAIGAGIGYFSGSAIIGAIAGGIFGVINYKVVSQYILHLQPKT